MRVISALWHILFPDKGGKSQMAEIAKSRATPGNRGAQDWHIRIKRNITQMVLRIFSIFEFKFRISPVKKYERIAALHGLCPGGQRVNAQW
jgi:hypothetical protein